jgi:hypothetical protein
LPKKHVPKLFFSIRWSTRFSVRGK